MKFDFCGTARAWRSVTRLAAVGVVGFIAPGCEYSSDPPTQVWGTVRYKGEPVKGGVILLAPEDGRIDSWGMGLIDSDGGYTVQTAHSTRLMPAGRYGVTFRGPSRVPLHRPHHEENDAAGGTSAEHAPPAAPGEIPEKYQDPEHPVFSIELGRRPIQVDITLRE